MKTGIFLVKLLVVVNVTWKYEPAVFFSVTDVISTQIRPMLTSFFMLKMAKFLILLPFKRLFL